MQNWVWLNGTVMPAEEARIGIFDAGFMQGIGLFETMRSYDGFVFRQQRHVDRLRASTMAFGWTVQPEAEELCEAVQQVARAAGGDARLRLTVTPGSLHAGGEEAPPLTIVATASPGQRYPDEHYQRGVGVIVSPCRQNPSDPTCGHKTTSYFARLAALRQAHTQGALEALWFTPDGHLAEGSISNVFIVRNGGLQTAPLDTPVLPGIARAAVLELAEAERLPTREEALTLDDVLAAEEVFLTNTMMEVLPVVRVGRRAIGNEKPGDLTRRLAIAYGHLIDREREAETA